MLHKLLDLKVVLDVKLGLDVWSELDVVVVSTGVLCPVPTGLDSWGTGVEEAPFVLVILEEAERSGLLRALVPVPASRVLPRPPLGLRM